MNAAVQLISKPWQTARAACWVSGFEAHMTEDDRGRPLLVVSRYGLTRSFARPEDVQQWLRDVVRAEVSA